MSTEKKIIFVAPFLNAFIKKDLDFLNQNFAVQTNSYSWEQKAKTPLFLIHQFFYFLFNTPNTDVVLIQFGGYWSLIPTIFGKIYRKPVFIVLHGTDCANIPSINYGSLRKKALRLFCGLSYKYATRLLPVSESLIKVENTYNSIEQHQGIRNHFPNLSTPHTTIPNGLDIEKWTESSVEKEKNSFISVFTNKQFILKGGDLIIEAAKLLPNCKFYMVGVNQPNTIEDLPENILFLGRLEFSELQKLYQKAQYHLQLSIFEGFGLALCEAMLNKCIPIGSSVNAIPTIIGETGYTIKTRSLSALTNTIKIAIANNNHIQLGIDAQNRIKELYPSENRQMKLLSVIKESL